MTKTYPVKRVEDHFAVVDESEPCGITRMNATVVGSGTILATIGKRVDELPLIELPNKIDELEDLISELPIDWMGTGSVKSAEAEEKAWNKKWLAYKADKAKFKYSEEDMRGAFKAGETERYGSRVEDVLKSKTPVSVELEFENAHHIGLGKSPYKEYDGWKCVGAEAACWLYERLKVSEGNIIYPVKINYE